MRLLKRPEEAIASIARRWPKGGDPEEIHCLLAGLGGEPPPPFAPRKFIIELFDQCADDFDRRLTADLNYRRPALIAGAIARFASPGLHDVLDLGCGTGLVGARLRSLARTLVGVDLSPNMLHKAQDRRIYDDLICADVIEFLQAKTTTFDVAAAGDLFIYLGDLSKAFHAIGNALKRGGLLVFSIETAEEKGFMLSPSLRYAHSVPYLRKLARDNHPAVESVERAIIRQEQHMDVNGHIITMRAPI